MLNRIWKKRTDLNHGGQDPESALCGAIIYTAFTSLKEEHFSPVVSVGGFPTLITIKLEYH